MDDHYAALQVTDTASPAVIRAAYRALTQRYHPDKNPDDPDAEAFLKRLNVA
jgi:curved DNA-binding protein CbpA